VRPVSRKAGAEAALIVRPHAALRLVPIDPPTRALVEALGRGAVLADAAAVATGVSAAFRLDSALGVLFAAGVFAAPAGGDRPPPLSLARR